MTSPPVDPAPSAPVDGVSSSDWVALADELLEARTPLDVLRRVGEFVQEALSPKGLRLVAWSPRQTGPEGNDGHGFAGDRNMAHPGTPNGNSALPAAGKRPEERRDLGIEATPDRIPTFALEAGEPVPFPLPMDPEAWERLPCTLFEGPLPPSRPTSSTGDRASAPPEENPASWSDLWGDALRTGASGDGASHWMVCPLPPPPPVPSGTVAENVASEPAPQGFLALRFPDRDPPHGDAPTTLALVTRLTALTLLRVRRQEDLAAVRRRHAELFRSVPIPLFVCDDTGCLVETNPAFRQLFPGASPLHLSDLHVEPEACRIWLTEATSGQAVHGHRVQLKGPGTEITAEVSAAPRRSGETRRPWIEGAIVDVSRQIDAEQEARIFTSALVQTDGAVCIADREGRIRFVNPSFEAMSGYREESLLGRPFDDLAHPPVPAGVTPPPSELLDRLLGGEVVRQERTATRSDGEEYTEARTITPIRDSRGQITHLISVSRDITSTRRLERQFHQAQKLEAVGRLAGGVAHDFNNLLTVIHGHVQLILMQLDPESPIRGDLEGMVQAGNRASSLVQQLLTFARREPSPISGPLALGAVLSAMESLLQRLIGENLELTVEIEEALPPVEIDRSRLEQVLANLVVNARDAMPQGGAIRIRAWSEAPRTRGGARQVFLSVEDSGMGIPAAIQERIFEPFFTTKEEGGGSGLGLATVYGIVRQAGGTVQVESEPGKGAIFTIQFAEAAPRSNLAAEAADVRGGQSPLSEHRGTERILLVEDHDLVRSITCSILRDQGYSVDEATTGEEALQLLGNDPAPSYDLVITDLLMRGMGGERLAAELRSRNPAYPLLFISGYRGSSDSGPVDIPGERIDVIPKPFTVPELIGAVRKVVEAGRGRLGVRMPG